MQEEQLRHRGKTSCPNLQSWFMMVLGRQSRCVGLESCSLHPGMHATEHIVCARAGDTKVIETWPLPSRRPQCPGGYGKEPALSG